MASQQAALINHNLVCHSLQHRQHLNVKHGSSMSRAAALTLNCCCPKLVANTLGTAPSLFAASLLMNGLAACQADELTHTCMGKKCHLLHFLVLDTPFGKRLNWPPNK